MARQTPEYREVRQTDLSGGLNDKRNQATLDPSETPDCTNIEFDTESVQSAGGAIKFGNEPAPGGAIRTHATMAPLYVMDAPIAGSGNALEGNVHVPLRGAAYFPYSQDTDIGGRFDYEGDYLANSEEFHNRRGTSFEVNVTFKLPPEEKLYSAPTNGASSPAAPILPMIPPHGFDQALDECVCILQKGGDRTAPMSWALAIVNVGAGVGITSVPGVTITTTPTPTDTTFTATTGVSVLAWDLSGVAVNDMAYTSDGYSACIRAVNDGTDTITVDYWRKNVSTGTPAADSTITIRRGVRPSNYCLAWIWYDAPQWGEHATTVMQYNLTSGALPTAGTYCTQAYRTILIGKFIEPGRDYSVSVQLSMDTGSPGALATNTDWEQDGAFKVFVWEDRRTWWYATAANTAAGVITQTSSDTGSAARLEVVRGPQDSLEYLCKYGVRYAGRDAVFAGLGMRFTPWARCGFIPFGSDCTPLSSGGFAMLDRSTSTITDLYGSGTHSLVFLHASGAAYVLARGTGGFAALGLTAFNANGGYDPKVALSSTTWEGLGASRNDEALRGYRLVTTENASGIAGSPCGAILTILSYTESGGEARVTIYDGANTLAFGTWGETPMLIQCWRWHQRDLVLGQISFSLTPTDYLDSDAMVASRNKIGLRMSHAVGDPTDTRLPTIAAYWPCDDAGAGYLRDVMSGGLRSGYRFPFANAVGPGGTRGKNLVFLSGEGEAIQIDLTESETFTREMERMLRGLTQGFGFEITCVFTEAFYPLQQDITLTNDAGVTLTGARPRCVPDIVTLDIASNEGRSNWAEPLLKLGFRAPLANTDGTPFKHPAGLGVEVAVFGDGDNRDLVQPAALQPWYVDGPAGGSDPHNRYSVDAPWVGKTVTIQVGVQTTNVSGEYDVYIALMPKSAFQPEDGDPSNVEMQYWTDSAANTSADGTYGGTDYYTSAHLNIRPKDIARAVLTVGGTKRAVETDGAAPLGVHELGARMLVDEIRWFIASPSGELGTYANQIATLTSRNGKLEGTNCLPPRELSDADMLQPLGANTRSVTVTEGSVTVTPPTGATFDAALARTSISAVKTCYLRLVMDDTLVAEEESLGEYEPRYQYVLTAISSSATLGTPYVGRSRSNAEAGVFRLAAYTSFSDDVRDLPLLLGRAGGYGATATDEDVLITQDLWRNPAVPGDAWTLRVYSPLGSLGSAELLPSWDRGMVFERRLQDDGILGLYGFNDTLYAGVRGAIYECDDRWRPDGPTEALRFSLAFRAREYPAGISGPRQGDCALFTNTTNARYSASPTDANFTAYDAWVKLDSIRAYQTLAWLGSLDSDPALSAGSTAHKIQWWWRFNAGRPEFVFGSTSTYDGTNRPEKGLFVAQGATAIPSGEWVHVRVSIPSADSGVNVQVPYIQVNGKNIGVTVNATGNGLTAPDWITAAGIVTGADASGVTTVILVGAARDSYLAPDPTVEFVPWGATLNPSGGQGTFMLPQRVQTLMHALGGRIAHLSVTRLPMWIGGGAPPDFDPFLIDYDVDGVYAGFSPEIQGYGVGHRIKDTSSGAFGVIQSSPFISAFHEMGTSRDLYSFASYGSQVYATNGGRPVVLFPGGGDA